MEIYKDLLLQKDPITFNKVLSFVVDLSDLKNNSLLGNKCAIITGSVTVKLGGLIPSEGSANGTRYAEICPVDNAESSVQRHLELLDLFTRPEKPEERRFCPQSALCCFIRGNFFQKHINLFYSCSATRTVLSL
jgi:hypothetical protein